MPRKLLIISFCVVHAICCQSQVLWKDSTLRPAADASLIKEEKALQFIAIGDWGRNGADHQKQVAKQLGITANELGSQFTISTGDNFYPSGVISEWDPSFKYSFEDIYTDFRLQWDWYPVLGNHDYKTDPDAQVRYSRISRRWKMPSRYYSQLLTLPGDTSSRVLILFIDTNPLIPEFYANKEYGPNVRTQDTLKQKRWIVQELSRRDPSVKWKIVVGHHPMYTGGSRTEAYDTRAIRRSLEPLLQKYGVDIYLTGHEHSLQHIQKGNLHHIVSGAASEKTAVTMTGGTEFAASAYGFFSFSVLPDKILVQAIGDDGKVLYQKTIVKK